MFKNISRTILATIIASLSVTSAIAGEKASLSYIGEYSIPTDHQYKDVRLGGLSGIAWDAKKQVYYAISDARNTDQEGKARVYTLKIDLSDKGIQSVEPVSMDYLLAADKSHWERGTVDAEGIVIAPDSSGLYWSSELGSPLRKSAFTGELLEDLKDSVPDYYNAGGKKDDPIGIRDGASIESLSISPDGKNLFMAVESALKQDGSIATPFASSPARVLKFDFDKTTGKPVLVGEYIYNVDPIPQVTEFGVSDNGISEVLALSNDRLLVVERAGRNASKGYSDWDFNIRAYIVDLSKATNILGQSSLAQIENKNTLQTLTKKLVIDFSDHTDSPDCIEGVTFGPLVDGKKTLIFVSDNNFQPYQRTKFFLFKDTNSILN